MPTLGLNSRLTTLRAVFAAVLITAMSSLFLPTHAWAFQDEPAADDPAGEVVAEEPAADAPADDGDEEAAVDPAMAEQSFLAWMINASGTFGLLILLLSFVMVALVMMNILQVRRDNFVPQAFIESFEQRLNARDYQGAYETARSDDSLVARVLAAGLGKLNQGYDKAVEGMQEVGDDENMALEHRLSYLALISAVAPMLGLMGTVSGMIDSFRTIATSATSPKPKLAWCARCIWCAVVHYRELKTRARHVPHSR